MTSQKEHDDDHGYWTHRVSRNEPAASIGLLLQHACLLVDDMSATLSELAARGLEITKAPIVGLEHNLQYWIDDPDGNPIELMQIVPASPHAAADARIQIRRR